MIDKNLLERSQNQCELCASTENLGKLLVSPREGSDVSDFVQVCPTCRSQINRTEELDTNHWRCLNDSIWSPVSAVKVIAYRMLHRLKDTNWAPDLLDMIYMEADELIWAKADLPADGDSANVHKDSNGQELQTGDSVVLIKDLKVKGANFTAKRGTAVRRITLDRNNTNHIEGKINGQHIVILTEFVKKSK